MKAKFTKNELHNAMQPKNKETVNTLTLVTTFKGEIIEPVTARFYMGRSSSASTVYCCIWINGNGTSLSGKGSAGGYGYHKESAALSEALDSAGIELYGSPYAHENGDEKKRAYINGCGSASMNAAIEAIGRALGYRVKKEIAWLMSCNDSETGELSRSQDHTEKLKEGK